MVMFDWVRAKLSAFIRPLLFHRSAQITFKGVMVFAFIVFLGSIVGNWLLTIFNVGDDPLGYVLAFMAPTTIVYVIWKKWGEQLAED